MPNHKQQIKKILRNLAGRGETITYGELSRQLSPAFSPRSARFHRLLNEICKEENAAGRGMLCVLVVRKSNGLPGEGFFEFAKKFNRDVSDKRNFWKNELKKVCSA